jgi:predicted nucleic acid-binding protein
VRIVLDTTILVRANERSHGLARELLLNVVESKHTLLPSNEMLHELAKGLRYPRLQAFYALTENLVFDYGDIATVWESANSPRLKLLKPRSSKSHATIIIPLDHGVIFVRSLDRADLSRRFSEVAQTLDAIPGSHFLTRGGRLDEWWSFGTI